MDTGDLSWPFLSLNIKKGTKNSAQNVMEDAAKDESTILATLGTTDYVQSIASGLCAISARGKG